MTLVVVLLFGLGAVLIASSIETDPATGHSVSVITTISQIWNGTLDFTQPGPQTSANAGGGGSGGQFAYVPPSPSTSTLAATAPGAYQNASTANYLQQRAI